jgi:Rrf2 family iron-sulfur cluster assembly transcriptional regulator
MGLSEQIRLHLDGISLQDVLQRKSVRMVAERQDQVASGVTVDIPLKRGLRV